MLKPYKCDGTSSCMYERRDAIWRCKPGFSNEQRPPSPFPPSKDRARVVRSSGCFHLAKVRSARYFTRQTRPAQLPNGPGQTSAWLGWMPAPSQPKSRAELYRYGRAVSHYMCTYLLRNGLLLTLSLLARRTCDGAATRAATLQHQNGGTKSRNSHERRGDRISHVHISVSKKGGSSLPDNGERTLSAQSTIH